MLELPDLLVLPVHLSGDDLVADEHGGQDSQGREEHRPHPLIRHLQAVEGEQIRPQHAVGEDGQEGGELVHLHVDRRLLQGVLIDEQGTDARQRPP